MADLRRLAVPEAIATDLREERFAEHTLQIAIQAALDAASYIVSDSRLGEPRSNRELFTLIWSQGAEGASAGDGRPRASARDVRSPDGEHVSSVGERARLR